MRLNTSLVILLHILYVITFYVGQVLEVNPILTSDATDVLVNFNCVSEMSFGLRNLPEFWFEILINFVASSEVV